MTEPAAHRRNPGVNSFRALALSGVATLALTASVAATLTGATPTVNPLALKPGPTYTQMNDPNFKLISALQDRVDALQKQLATLQRDYAAHAHRYVAPVCAYENLATFKQELARGSTSVGVCVVDPVRAANSKPLTSAPTK
jgi:hypothetical protein